MPTVVQEGLSGVGISHRPISERFAACDAQHPWIYRAVEDLVHERAWLRGRRAWGGKRCSSPRAGATRME